MKKRLFIIVAAAVIFLSLIIADLYVYSRSVNSTDGGEEIIYDISEYYNLHMCIAGVEFPTLSDLNDFLFYDGDMSIFDGHIKYWLSNENRLFVPAGYSENMSNDNMSILFTPTYVCTSFEESDMTVSLECYYNYVKTDEDSVISFAEYVQDIERYNGATYVLEDKTVYYYESLWHSYVWAGDKYTYLLRIECDGEISPEDYLCLCEAQEVIYGWEYDLD